MQLEPHGSASAGTSSFAIQAHCFGSAIEHLRKVQLHVLPERVQRLGGLDGWTLSRIWICIKHAQKNCNHLILNSSIIAEEFADELWSCGLCSDWVSECYTEDECQVVCPQCGNLASVIETPQLQRLRRRIGSLCDPQRQWWCLGVKDLPTLQGVEGWASTLMLDIANGKTSLPVWRARCRFCLLVCFVLLFLLAFLFLFFLLAFLFLFFLLALPLLC